MHQVSSYYSLVISCGSSFEDPSEKHVRELAIGEKVEESFLGESKDRKRRCFIARIRSWVGLLGGLEAKDLNFM